MSKRTGTLSYDFGSERFELISDSDYNDRVPLHCGDCLEVWDGKKWTQTRVEYDDGWYLAGCDHLVMAGAKGRHEW